MACIPVGIESKRDIQVVHLRRVAAAGVAQFFKGKRHDISDMDVTCAVDIVDMFQ